MTNPIKISVIVPCYNSAPYIEETIESIANQTIISKLELIIVNDGSTDHSLKIINDIKIKYAFIPIYIINQENKGLSGARNSGAKHAKGEFIVFIDSDDKIHPTYLEKSINLFDSSSELQIIYSKAKFFDAKKGGWKLPDFNLNSFLVQNCIPAFAVLRTKVFNDFGGFDENLKFTEDWELWIRYQIAYPNCVYRLPEVLFYYRKRNNQSSMIDKHLENRTSEKALIYIYNKHYDFFYENNMGLDKLFNAFKYKDKYYNTWYRKLFYFFKTKKN